MWHAHPPGPQGPPQGPQRICQAVSPALAGVLRIPQLGGRHSHGPGNRRERPAQRPAGGVAPWPPGEALVHGSALSCTVCVSVVTMGPRGSWSYRVCPLRVHTDCQGCPRGGRYPLCGVTGHTSPSMNAWTLRWLVHWSLCKHGGADLALPPVAWGSCPEELPGQAAVPSLPAWGAAPCLPRPHRWCPHPRPSPSAPYWSPALHSYNRRMGARQHAPGVLAGFPPIGSDIELLSTG